MAYSNTYLTLRKFEINVDGDIDNKIKTDNNTKELYCSNFKIYNRNPFPNAVSTVNPDCMGYEFVTGCYQHNLTSHETNGWVTTSNCTNYRNSKQNLNDITINKINSEISEGKPINFESYNSLKNLLKNEVSARLNHYLYKNDAISALRLSYYGNLIFNSSDSRFSAQLISSSSNGGFVANAIPAFRLSNITDISEDLKNILNNINDNYNGFNGLTSNIFQKSQIIDSQSHNDLVNALSSIYKLVKDIEYKIQNTGNSNLKVDEILDVTDNINVNAVQTNDLITTNKQKIMINTLSSLMCDCICYSDCVSFGYCNCYGFCGCNYSDERLKNSILYISDIKKEF